MMQSGAAIVAIVGGMAVARFVSSRRDFDISKAAAESANRQSERLHESAEELRRNALRLEAEMLATTGAIYYETAHHVEPEYLSETHLYMPQLALQKEFESRCAKRLELLDDYEGELEALVKTSRAVNTWEEAGRRVPIRKRIADQYLWKYAYVVALEEKAAREGQLWWDEVTRLRRELDAAVDQHQDELEHQLGRAKTQETGARTAANDAIVEAARAHAEFERVKAGDDYALIIRVLGYAAVLMICYPLVLLSLPLMEVPLVWRLCAVVPFVAGLGLMARFMAVYAAYLNGKIERVPSTLSELAGAPRGRLFGRHEDPLGLIVVKVSRWERFKDRVRTTPRRLLPRVLLWGPVAVALVMLSVFATFVVPLSTS